MADAPAGRGHRKHAIGFPRHRVVWGAGRERRGFMSINRRSILEFIGRSAVLGGLQGLPAVASAQAYPDKPIHIVVPFPPGGSLDGTPRIVAQHIAARRGWSIVIDNRPGAGGQLGTVIGKQAPTDGYLLTAING